MTDNEIIKALECCANGDTDECQNCPYVEKYPYCDGPMERDVLDLINRLQAENERLKEKGIVVLLKPENAQFENLEHFETRQISKEMLPAIVRRVKAEAYKECIQKIKIKSKKEHLVCSGASLRTDYTITVKDLKNLLKELVGEDK